MSWPKHVKLTTYRATGGIDVAYEIQDFMSNRLVLKP